MSVLLSELAADVERYTFLSKYGRQGPSSLVPCPNGPLSE